MKNKKLLQYFTDQILPILEEIEFSDEKQKEFIQAQETLDQVLNKFKLQFNSNNLKFLELNNDPKNVSNIALEVPLNNNSNDSLPIAVAA
ncbi:MULTISPECIES: hypothetical protein [Enterococcus]|uniref:hypothetical protein n=1 Tax=Enterococcus TaxID=1350 RepID=UPI000FFF4047|nr:MULTISPECIES: hypothetical protein [Enterococcus]MDT2149741.1 hypothetical protein [Enterococcus faecalis]RXE96102.1 hypothetical protein EG866_15425 [Enterococcus faecalis]RXF06159.1 hypothetical protein EG869_03895 [Enterococcus faecium]RXF07945.1 hypothetical protein EG870_15660 [Enterococcus faecalis]RXF10245.1 hypothetical protein EG878_15925 [Enterococcus faecalis]